MKRAETVVASDGKFYGIHIRCPGCDSGHVLPVKWLPEGQEESSLCAGKPHWDFDGDFERPTLNPSILSRWSHVDLGENVCHSFVRAGRIQSLDDCTHAFKGQTVDLLDVEIDA